MTTITFTMPTLTHQSIKDIKSGYLILKCTKEDDDILLYYFPEYADLDIDYFDFFLYFKDGKMEWANTKIQNKRIIKASKIVEIYADTIKEDMYLSNYDWSTLDIGVASFIRNLPTNINRILVEGHDGAYREEWKRTIAAHQ